MVNATAAVVCLLVVLIFSITEFTRGAWVVVVVMPHLDLRPDEDQRPVPHRRRRAGRGRGAAGVRGAGAAPAQGDRVGGPDRPGHRPGHPVRPQPDSRRAVRRAFQQRQPSGRGPHAPLAGLGLSRLPLEVIEVADRRISRAALEMAVEAAGDGETEVSMLIPTRTYRRSWAVLLHGKNADRLVRVLGHVPHVNATLVPFNVADLAESQRAFANPELFLQGGRPSPARHRASRSSPRCAGAIPISGLRLPRVGQGGGPDQVAAHSTVVGRSRLECTLADGSGAELSGGLPGTAGDRRHPDRNAAGGHGMVGERRGRLAMINPEYELLSVPENDPAVDRTPARSAHQAQAARPGPGGWRSVRWPAARAAPACSAIPTAVIRRSRRRYRGQAPESCGTVPMTSVPVHTGKSISVTGPVDRSPSSDHAPVAGDTRSLAARCAVLELAVDQSDTGHQFAGQRRDHHLGVLPESHEPGGPAEHGEIRLPAGGHHPVCRQADAQSRRRTGRGTRR